MCELRSGLQGASTAGDPGCRMHPGRGSGVVFSWLLLFGHPKRSDSADWPKRCCFKKEGRQRKAKIAGGASSHKAWSDGEKRRRSAKRESSTP